MGQDSIDNKLLQNTCLPQGRAWVRISLGGLFADHFGQNTVVQEEFLEPEMVNISKEEKCGIVGRLGVGG